MPRRERKPGEVPFSDRVWLMRYNDQPNWFDIRKSRVEQDMRRHHPDDWEHKMWLMEEGSYTINTPYAEYMFLADSAYQDELPINNLLVDQGYYKYGDF